MISIHVITGMAHYSLFFRSVNYNLLAAADRRLILFISALEANLSLDGTLGK